LSHSVDDIYYSSLSYFVVSTQVLSSTSRMRKSISNPTQCTGVCLSLVFVLYFEGGSFEMNQFSFKNSHQVSKMNSLFLDF
jgi:hypothetical protein